MYKQYFYVRSANSNDSLVILNVLEVLSAIFDLVLCFMTSRIQLSKDLVSITGITFQNLCHVMILNTKADFFKFTFWIITTVMYLDLNLDVVSGVERGTHSVR